MNLNCNYEHSFVYFCFNAIFYSEAIRYCFGPIVQRQINDLVYEWNLHRIRPSRYAEAPGGVPEVLYFIPQQSGNYYMYRKFQLNIIIIMLFSDASDHKCTVDLELLDHAEASYGTRLPMCTPEFESYVNCLQQDYSLSSPQTLDDALQLFFLITEDVSALKAASMP